VTPGVGAAVVLAVLAVVGGFVVVAALIVTHEQRQYEARHRYQPPAVDDVEIEVAQVAVEDPDGPAHDDVVEVSG